MGGMSSLIAITAPWPVLIMNVDADYATSYACEQMVNAARPYYRVLGVESRIQHTMWAYDLLCVVEFLEGQQEFDRVFVAGSGRDMGLACLLASVLDERIKGAAIDVCPFDY